MTHTVSSLIDIPVLARGAPVLTVVVPCYNERPNVAPIIARLDAALYGIPWEVVCVDDNSPDGTAAEVRRIAQTDARARCIRRIGRRGLSSAVIEGALSSSAQFVAVIDGDLQHDETKLPDMLTALQSGQYDLAVGSRHSPGGGDAGLATRWRHVLSQGGIRLAQYFLPIRLSDPMSGFFMLPRSIFECLAGNLTGQGFKILLDLALSAPAPLRVIEIPFMFHERAAGESKLDALVLVQFAGLLLDHGGRIPLLSVMTKMPIAVLGIDLGKNSCSVAGLDMHGAVVLRRRMTRESLVAFASKLPACIVAMEACCGAHFLGRTFAAQGHTVRLMSPEYVQPYVKSQKTDDRDAEAIAEAATRPTMRLVTLKSEEQLDLQVLHRARERLIAARTRLDQSIARSAARARGNPAQTSRPSAASTARAHGRGTADQSPRHTAAGGSP